MNKKIIGLLVVISLILVSLSGAVSAFPVIDGSINNTNYPSEVINATNNHIHEINETGSLGSQLPTETFTEEKQVVNETVTINYTSTVDLSYSDLVNGTVEIIDSGGATLTEGTDYTMDLANGTIDFINTTETTLGNEANVTYNYTTEVTEQIGTFNLIKHSNGTVEANVSHEVDGERVSFTLTVSKEVIDIDTAGELLVKLDNESISLAENKTDALELINNETTEYFVVNVTSSGFQVIISNNNWSTHTLLFEEATSTGIIGGSIDDATNFLTQEIGPMQLWIYLVLAFVALVVIASKLEGG